MLGSGCAIKYYDKESGTEHLWGFGHLRMKAEPSKDAVVRSVVTGVETLGFSLLVGEENRGVGLGYDNRKKMRIMDDASVALEFPTNSLPWGRINLFDARVGAAPPWITNLNEKHSIKKLIKEIQNKKIKRVVILLAMPFLFQGCVGYDRTLFVTKTNVGIDIDTQPPTAEINIGRKEIVIEPTFANGETPPVLGSFSMQSKGMFADVSSTFSGGDAAVIMATLYSDGTVLTTDADYATRKADFDSTITLDKKPSTVKLNLKGTKLKSVTLNENTNTKTFYFATDTSIGMKVTWNGATAAMPDSFKLGFNRKEFALAPVFGAPNATDPNKYDVKMPSFLATIDSSAGTGTLTNTGLAVEQYFATGKAADRMALRQPVRMAMAKRLDPAAEQLIEKGEIDRTDPNTAKINAWLDADSANVTTLKDWLSAREITAGVTNFMDWTKFKKDRQDFVTEHSIQ